jgi:regulator of sigma E protease
VLIEREVNGEKVRKTVTLALDENPIFGIKMPAIKAKHRVVITGEEAERFPESLGDDRPQDGDELVAINGQKIRNAQDALGFLDESRGEINLTLRRGVGDDAREWEVPYEPRRHFYTNSSAFIAGVSIVPPPYVNLMRKGGPADVAGLKKGDRFVALVNADGNETPLNSFGDLSLMVDQSGGTPMRFKVMRDGAPVQVSVTPEPRETHPGRYQLGMLISATDPRDHKKVGDEDLLEASGGKLIAHGVRPGSQAAQAGLKPGDVIVGLKLDGEEQTNPDNGNVDAVAFSAAMFDASRAATIPEITFQVQRDGGTKDIKVSPDSKGPESGAYMEVATAELRSDPVTYGLIESVEQGFYHSKKVGYKIMMTLSALVTGRVKIWHLGGPVVIAKRSYSLAQWGIGTLIFFLAFISINLAIVNMIPLPVLDGGQWLIVTIEAIRGKPLPEKAMTWVSLPSFIAVLLLMAFVLANDLVTVFVRKWV